MAPTTLSTRLATGYLATIAALLVVVVVVLTTFHAARGHAAAVHDNYLPSIDAAQRLLVQLERMENAEFMYYASKTERATWFQRFDAASQAFDAAFLEAENLAISAEERAVIVAMGRHHGAFLHVDARMRAKIARGMVDDARRLNATESLDAAAALRDEARRLYDFNLSEAARSRATADRALGDASGIALVALVVGVLAALASWRRATHAVVEPVRALERAAASVARGARERIAVPGAAGTRELASLAVAIDHMATRLLDENASLEREVDARTHALRDAKARLEALVEELRSLDRMKSNLLAVISHELLTPINIVVGWADVLADGLDGDLSPAQRGAVDEILGASERLTRMVRNALLYARLESGEITLVGAACAPGEVIGAAAARAADKAAARDVRIELTAPADLPPAWADPERVAQVLDELLDNAIHFARTGGAVAVRVAARDEAIEVEVADDGPGITDEALARIFQPFYQADLGSTREHGGLGLGLAVAHRLVTRMGGHLMVAARQGPGATFRFNLPRPGRTPVQPRARVDARSYAGIEATQP